MNQLKVYMRKKKKKIKRMTPHLTPYAELGASQFSGVRASWIQFVTHCITINTRHANINVNSKQNGETNKGTSSKGKWYADENPIMVIDSQRIHELASGK